MKGTPIHIKDIMKAANSLPDPKTYSGDEISVSVTDSIETPLLDVIKGRYIPAEKLVVRQLLFRKRQHINPLTEEIKWYWTLPFQTIAVEKEE